MCGNGWRCVASVVKRTRFNGRSQRIRPDRTDQIRSKSLTAAFSGQIRPPASRRTRFSASFGQGHGRVLSYPPSAALCLRTGQPGQGGRAERGRRYHRPRHGQSGPADAGPCHRKTQGYAGQAPYRPLLRLARDHGPAQGAGRLLRPPFRGQAQPRNPDRGDARLQGRLCQRSPGDHRARRRGAVSEPELSDPRIWISDGRRRDPLGALGADAAILRGVERAIIHSIPKPLAIVVCYPVQPDGLCREPRFLPRPGGVREEARDLHPVGPCLCRGLFRR